MGFLEKKCLLDGIMTKVNTLRDAKRIKFICSEKMRDLKGIVIVQSVAFSILAVGTTPMSRVSMLANKKGKILEIIYQLAVFVQTPTTATSLKME